MILSSPESVRHAVHRSLEDPSVVCVFPTEIAVRFWLEDYAATSEAGIIRSDRAIAWDTFRSRFLPTCALLPANRMIRLLFARTTLANPDVRDSLQWFRYDDPSFSNANLAQELVGALLSVPELERLREQDDEAYERLPRSYRDDLAYVAGIYRSFLAKNGLFEPNFLVPSVQHAASWGSLRHRIFFPEVCEGWESFHAMQPFPEWVEVYEGDGATIDARLTLHANELMELKASLAEVARFLDQGHSSREIIMTVGNLERWLPRLEHEASLQDVPLSIAGGRPVLLYPPGRFLQGLLELSTSRFSIEKMRSFLLDPRMPWKDAAIHRALIRRGIELSVRQGDEHPGKDQWILKLGASMHAGDSRLLGWYRMLRSLTGNLMRSRRVDELMKALFPLLDMLLSDATWPGGEDQEGAKVLAFCLDRLKELDMAMTTCSIEGIPQLYALFLQLLARQTYVAARRTHGIAVYPYGVSVGICPACHLVLGCTLDDTRVKRERFALLGEHVLRHEDESDQSERLLDHYRLSGSVVRFSASRTLFGNTSALVPPWFVDHDALEEQKVVYDDVQQRELEAWSSPAPREFVANFRQAVQFNFARQRTCKLAKVDMAQRTAIPALGIDHPIRLSATELDRFFACPMKWASASLLHLEKGAYDITVMDHAAIGIRLHRILERFCREVQQRSGTWDAGREAEYRAILGTIAAEVFGEYGRSVEAPTPSTMYYITTRYTRELMAIIEAESRAFDGFGSLGFELSVTTEADGYTVYGRIDRMLVRQETDGRETIALVDYKKRYSGSKKSYAQHPERMPSRQLPLYAWLLSTEGISGTPKEVSIGAFYDIAGGKYIPIWDQRESDLRDTLIETVKRHMALMAKDLREGRLGATPSKDSCAFCDYRQICRRRYALV